MRRWWITGAVLLTLAGGALAWLRYRAVPAPVRTLPGGDALVYLDLAPLRQAGWLQPDGGIDRAPDYAAFVRASGFDFERDLDAVAVSLSGPPMAPQSTTAVLAGRFPPSFQAYLASHALHRLTLGTAVGYQFPGWSRPGQPLTVIPEGGAGLIVTNDADPGGVAARRFGFRRAPGLWQRGWALWPPLGYVALNPPSLAAFHNAQRLQASLQAAADASLALYGVAAFATPADAAQTRTQLETALARLRSALPSGGADRPSLGTLLDQLALIQDGAQLQFTLRLDRATLAGWQHALNPAAALK